MHVGAYNLKLEASLSPSIVYSYNFTVNLEEYIYPNTDAPKFKTNLENTLNVYLGAATSYSFPKIKDADEDAFTCQVLSTPDFVTFDPTQNILSINPTEEKSIGDYMIKVVLTDKNIAPKSRNYDLKISVHKFDIAKL